MGLRSFHCSACKQVDERAQGGVGGEGDYGHIFAFRHLRGVKGDSYLSCFSGRYVVERPEGGILPVAISLVDCQGAFPCILEGKSGNNL